MYDFLSNAPFPCFRQFTTKDVEAYKNLYQAHFTPYADISPANLLVWFDINHSLEIALLDEAIVLRYDNPFDHDAKNYLILEPDVSEDHVRRIYDLPGNDTTHIKEQPALFVRSLESNPAFRLVDNIDSQEYILDTHLLAGLAGGTISRLREETSFFERNNKAITVEHITTVSRDDKQLLDRLVSSWHLTAHDKTKDGHVPNLEREALKIAIETLDLLQRQVMLVRVDSQPVGLAIYAIYDDTAIIGHIKVDYDFKFAFGYTTHRLAQLLVEAGVDFMNFEQDLGIEGLRHHKMLLRPIKMLRKVDINLVDQIPQTDDI